MPNFSTVLPRVCWRRVHREAERAGVALVVRRGQNNGGRALAQLVGNGERVEQQHVVADLDRVRRYELGPPLLLVPGGMRRLPMPYTGAQLIHARDAMSAGMEETNRTDSLVAAVGESTL
jgi:hypothetical protein